MTFPFLKPSEKSPVKAVSGQSPGRMNLLGVGSAKRKGGTEEIAQLTQFTPLSVPLSAL